MIFEVSFPTALVIYTGYGAVCSWVHDKSEMFFVGAIVGSILGTLGTGRTAAFIVSVEEYPPQLLAPLPQLQSVLLGFIAIFAAFGLGWVGMKRLLRRSRESEEVSP